MEMMWSLTTSSKHFMMVGVLHDGGHEMVDFFGTEMMVSDLKHEETTEDVSEHVDQPVCTLLDRTSWDVVRTCNFPCGDLSQSSLYISGFEPEDLIIGEKLTLLVCCSEVQIFQRSC